MDFCANTVESGRSSIQECRLPYSSNDTWRCCRYLGKSGDTIFCKYSLKTSFYIFLQSVSIRFIIEQCFGEAEGTGCCISYHRVVDGQLWAISIATVGLCVPTHNPTRHLLRQLDHHLISQFGSQLCHLGLQPQLLLFPPSPVKGDDESLLERKTLDSTFVYFLKIEHQDLKKTQTHTFHLFCTLTDGKLLLLHLDVMDRLTFMF